MGDKEVKEFQRIELATYLERLARELRTGTLDEDCARWKIPRRIDAKIDRKEKKDILAAKLSLNRPTLGGYSKADRKEITSWKKSFELINRNPNASFSKLQKMAEKGLYCA
jgi:hypothetical protein